MAYDATGNYIMPPIRRAQGVNALTGMAMPGSGQAFTDAEINTGAGRFRSPVDAGDGSGGGASFGPPGAATTGGGTGFGPPRRPSAAGPAMAPAPVYAPRAPRYGGGGGYSGFHHDNWTGDRTETGAPRINALPSAPSPTVQSPMIPRTPEDRGGIGMLGPDFGQTQDLGLIKYMAHGGSARAGAIVVGDPQEDGKPNPEVVMSASPMHVVPIKDMPKGMARYANGTDNPPPLPADLVKVPQAGGSSALALAPGNIYGTGYSDAPSSTYADASQPRTASDISRLLDTELDRGSITPEQHTGASEQLRIGNDPEFVSSLASQAWTHNRWLEDHPPPSAPENASRMAASRSQAADAPPLSRPEDSGQDTPPSYGLPMSRPDAIPQTQTSSVPNSFSSGSMQFPQVDLGSPTAVPMGAPAAPGQPMPPPPQPIQFNPQKVLNQGAAIAKAAIPVKVPDLPPGIQGDTDPFAAHREAANWQPGMRTPELDKLTPSARRDIVRQMRTPQGRQWLLNNDLAIRAVHNKMQFEAGKADAANALHAAELVRKGQHNADSLNQRAQHNYQMFLQHADKTDPKAIAKAQSDALSLTDAQNSVSTRKELFKDDAAALAWLTHIENSKTHQAINAELKHFDNTHPTITPGPGGTSIVSHQPGTATVVHPAGTSTSRPSATKVNPNARFFNP